MDPSTVLAYMIAFAWTSPRNHRDRECGRNWWIHVLIW